MGSTFRFACDSCSVDRTEMVGVGFSGIHQHICACDTCHTFVEVETNEIEIDEEADRAAFTCKKCSSPLREIASPHDDDLDEDDLEADEYYFVGACPTCGGSLYEMEPEVFIVWD